MSIFSWVLSASCWTVYEAEELYWRRMAIWKVDACEGSKGLM